jgi:glycosyltransferase involved in cell wall biosynthesis
VVPPAGSATVAELLREHDVFITASLHEACSNAVLEALACGLPVIYVHSGSHAELVGEAGYAYDDPEEIPALLDRLREEYDARRAAISIPSLGEVADRYLEAMGVR